MAIWALPVLEIATPKNPRALADVVPLVERLEAAFGTRPIAKLLGVGAGTVTNWKRRRHAISPEYAKRIIELHDVFVRALQVFQPRVADGLAGWERAVSEWGTANRRPRDARCRTADRRSRRHRPPDSEVNSKKRKRVERHPALGPFSAHTRFWASVALRTVAQRRFAARPTGVAWRRPPWRPIGCHGRRAGSPSRRVARWRVDAGGR